MDTIYKIRRRRDGLFSKGGSYPRFSKAGKMWSTIPHLKRHLSNMGMSNFERYYSDCEIVEYIENGPISLVAVMEEAEARRLELQQQREERMERWRRQRLERERARIERELAELK
jgi:hypothetical protein